MCFNQVWESGEIPYYEILELFLFLYEFILLVNQPISLLERDGIQGGSPLYINGLCLNQGKDWPSLG